MKLLRFFSRNVKEFFSIIKAIKLTVGWNLRYELSSECAANIPFNYHFLTALSLYERPFASDFNRAYFDFDDNCDHSGGSMKENELSGNLVNNIG